MLRGCALIAGLIAATTPFAVGKPSSAPAAPTAPAPSAAPAGPLTADEQRLLDARRRLADAAGDAERLAAARALLAEFDRQGEGRGREARRLVDMLLEAAPQDPALLWRRADDQRRARELDAALGTLTHLVEVAPAHPLAARARRALPALLLETGRREQSVRADEDLLERRAADPGAVLARLARTYALLGDLERARAAVTRLGAAGADRLRYDPDLAWIGADATAASAAPRAAAAALLRFANLFPDDPRRPEALLRAARSLQAAGSPEVALRLMNEALAVARTPSLELAGRLDRGEVLTQTGAHDAARADYERVFGDASDRDTAARALGRVVDIVVGTDGPDAALALLAAKVEAKERFAAECVPHEWRRVLARLGDGLALQPDRAAYVAEVAERARLTTTLPPDVRLSAAALREQVGAYDKAAALYAGLAGAPGATGARAREGLVRCRPREVAPGTAPAEPARLAGLVREEAWTLVLGALTGSRAIDPATRTLAARSAFMAGRPAEAKDLLEPLPHPKGEAALLRADARALAGDWPAACRDYRAAPGQDLVPVEAAWLEVRIGACALREGRLDEARARVRAVLEASPAEPAGSAAHLLQAAVDEAAKKKTTAPARRARRPRK